MEIVLKRDTFTKKSTIGTLTVNGIFECYILEDVDRGLKDTMSLEEIAKLKVHGQTAIPYGVYKVVVTRSDRFSNLLGHDVYLPLLLGVKGFTGIRIHSGVKPEDTEGCQLPGRKKGVDTISESKLAFAPLNEKINAAIKAGEIVTYQIIK
jgi:Family of unknown function (DUF5675)